MIIAKNSYRLLLDNCTINNKYAEFINNLSNNLDDNKNLILYGPSGSGKYSEALKIIEKYSPSNLKYEKKIVINTTKIDYIVKISDIHYEVDIENLSCNSKSIWIDIFNNIVDIIQYSTDKKGIILCKNFHTINNELLDIFYSYMQKNINTSIKITYIIITDHISFIPDNILNISKILYYSKFSHNNYIKLSNTNNKKFLTKNKNNSIIYNNISNINILKYINLNDDNFYILNVQISICDYLIKIIISKNIDLIKIRNVLYDILILNLDIYECIYYILEKLIEKKYLRHKENNINNLLLKTLYFCKYYNNNYRPIYHLESYILYLIKEINEY